MLSTDGAVEARVSTGRLGFKKQFENNADPLLTKIVAFRRARKYGRISETIRDELFFK
jgi:hypothetical protein